MRNKTIDAFRGLIVIIMALDHASYFIIDTHFYEGFDYISHYPTTIAFFTRWITHLCAPGFFFAMGYGLYKAYEHKRRTVLLIRALFIIALQFTIVNLIWDNTLIYFGVLNALAISMIIIVLFMPLVKRFGVILFIVSVLASHFIINSDLIHMKNFLLRLFFIPGHINNSYILYTIFPWIGISFLGVYLATKEKIKYMEIGLVFISVFFLLSFGKTYSIQSFLTVIKYPASIRFILLTMSLNMFLLHFLEKLNSSLKDFLSVYGKASLFFYVGHLILYAFLSRYINRTDYTTLYITWLSGIILLYYPSRFYYKFKKEVL